MLQVLTPLLAIFAIVLVRMDRRIVEELRRAQATTAGSAIRLDGSGLRGIRIKRLTTIGCLHLLSDDRYYLDEQGWNDWRFKRRRRMIAVLVVLVSIIGIIILLRQS